MFHEALKICTEGEHRSIEAAVNFKEITSSSESYSELLKKFYGYYLPIEKLLVEFMVPLKEIGINLSERTKVNFLEHDLKLMGITPSAENQCKDLPKLRNVYEALGVLYVLEGSTLGGQVIHKYLMERNNFIRKNELQFHLGYKDQTIQMWNQFKTILNSIPGDHEAEVITAAKNTFSTLKNWITQNDKH